MDRQTSHPIGTAKGPGQTQHEYTFVTPDREHTLKAGEFVYYRAEADGEERDILGRVTQRSPLRLYPDAFMLDPQVSPGSIATMLGFEQQDHEQFEVTVAVLGYYHQALGDFINPRVPPRAGSPIFVASDGMLATVLSKKLRDAAGSIHIGSLLSRAKDAVPVVLDARAITSTHAAIIASTGAGKSYLAGVLLEELLGPRNRAAVLVVDPHGEYDTLIDLMQRPEFAERGYRPEVCILRPADVKVRISSLTLADLRYLLPSLSERMHWQLGRAFHIVQSQKGDKWTLEDLLGQVRHQESHKHAKQEDEETEQEEKPDEFGTGQALAWRLEATLGSSGTFSNFENLKLQSMFRPGLCTVLQLNEIDEREQRVIVATLLRRLWKARMDTDKGIVDEQGEFYLPYPAFVLIEEAHRFAPASADTVSSQVLKTILSEGRKFGVAVGLISQRPGKLDSDVLSQCMTQFIMHIVNPIDQDRVAESVETVGRDLLRELPALSKGQVIVAGTAVNTPVLCRVRQRITRHGAEDPDAPARWLEYFEQAAKEQRGRESALPVQRSRKRSGPFKQAN